MSCLLEALRIGYKELDALIVVCINVVGDPSVFHPLIISLTTDHNETFGFWQTDLYTCPLCRVIRSMPAVRYASAAYVQQSPRFCL